MEDYVRMVRNFSTTNYIESVENCSTLLEQKYIRVEMLMKCGRTIRRQCEDRQWTTHNSDLRDCICWVWIALIVGAGPGRVRSVELTSGQERTFWRAMEATASTWPRIGRGVVVNKRAAPPRRPVRNKWRPSS